MGRGKAVAGAGAAAAAGAGSGGKKSRGSSAEPDAAGKLKGGAHLHFSAAELKDLVMCVGPEYQAGNRGDISWLGMSTKLNNMGYAMRGASSVQNKFRVLLKSYQAIKQDEEKGTGVRACTDSCSTAFIIVACCGVPMH